MDNDQFFINKLIEETMNEAQTTPENNVVSLQDYFESHLKSSQRDSHVPVLSMGENQRLISHLLSAAELKHFKGVYLPYLGAFRFRHSKGLFDIPSNWSCFANLKSKLNDGIMFIDESNDANHLRKIFGRMNTTALCFMIIDEKIVVVIFSKEQLAFYQAAHQLAQQNLLSKAA